MVNCMKKEPLFFICIAFILGIVFQEQYPMNFLFLLITFSVLVLVSITVYFLKNRFAEYALISLFFSFGALTHQIQQPKTPLVEVVENQDVEFQLVKKLNSNASNRRYVIQIFNDSSVFLAVASIPKEQAQLDFFHRYQGKGFLRFVEPPQNSYQFDYQKYLNRQGVFYQIYFPNAVQAAKLTSISIPQQIKQSRLDLLNSINTIPKLSYDTKELLKGISLADRPELNASIVSDFNKTGLVHILAISGSHMVVIFALIYFVFSKIGLPKKMVIVISLISIWLFSILIDYGNSVVRSALMLTIYYAYVILERKPDLIHSLSLSALIILLWDTNQIFDVGFQLSFIAVLGIFWLNKPISNLFPETKNVFLNYAKAVFSLTLSAQLATLPLILYYFHQFPLISIVANLVMVFVAQLFIVFAFCYVFLIALGLHFHLLNWFYEQFARVFLKLVHFFGSFDGQLIERIPINTVEVVILFFLLYLLRTILVKKTIKDVLRFSFVFLLFCSFRLYFDYRAYYVSEAVFHTTFKSSVFSIKNRDHVTFYIPDNSDRPSMEKYTIYPYLVDRRAKTYSISTFPAGTTRISYNGKRYNLENKDR